MCRAVAYRWFACEPPPVRRVTPPLVARPPEGYNGLGMCLAIPACVVELTDEPNRIALVDVAGVRRNVNVGLLHDSLDELRVGDWVLVHVGFAISKIDEHEALATRRLLERMGAEYEQELAELKASVIE
jgi:hydrogenase expression/formation protein HypC